MGALSRYAGATAEHLSWIATGRAQFQRLPDTIGTLAGFFFLYCLFGIVSHLAIGTSVGQAVAVMAFHLVFILVLFERPYRSSSMVGVAMGCSIIVDLCRILLFIAGAASLGSEVLTGLMEATLLWLNHRHFKSMPRNVQSRGYRRR